MEYILESDDDEIVEQLLEKIEQDENALFPSEENLYNEVIIKDII